MVLTTYYTVHYVPKLDGAKAIGSSTSEEFDKWFQVDYGDAHHIVGARHQVMEGRDDGSHSRRYYTKRRDRQSKEEDWNDDDGMASRVLWSVSYSGGRRMILVARLASDRAIDLTPNLSQPCVVRKIGETRDIASLIT